MRSAATRSALHAFRPRIAWHPGWCSYRSRSESRDRQERAQGPRRPCTGDRWSDQRPPSTRSSSCVPPCPPAGWSASVPHRRSGRARDRPLRRGPSGGRDGPHRSRPVHIDHPDALSGASASRFRTAAVQAGAIGTVSLPWRPTNHIHKATRKLCALPIQSREAKGRSIPHAGKIASSTKESSFAFDVWFPQLPESSEQGFNEKCLVILG